VPRRVWLGAGLAAVVALFLPGVVLKALLLSAVAVVALSALWLDAVRRGVDVEVDVPTRLVRGEVGTLEVVVRNRSRLPAPRVRAFVRLHAGGVTPSETVVEVSLPGRSQRRLTTDLTAHTRGRWRATPLTIELSDPLGLAVHRFDGRTPDEVVVLPTIVPVRRLELPAVAPVPELADERALLADPMAIVGVRPYQPGDPLRSIHWPATAAAGTLVRREVERAWARDLVVVLDLDEQRYGRGHGARLERAITTAASVLADSILRQRQPAGLALSVPRPRGAAAETASFRVGASRGHLDAMLVHLADVRWHDAVPMDELLARLARREQPGTTVVVVTPEPMSVVGEPAARLRAAGLTPAVLHVGGRRVGRRAGAGRITTPVLAVEDGVPLSELVL
jgi:uncharacterized protein (DUF58 family)